MDPTGAGTGRLSPATSQADPAWRAVVADLLWLLAVWAAVYLTHLGTRELRGEEPHRVEPALAMVESGHWAVPTVGGEPYYRKPPLFNWLVALSFQLTGQRTEFTARLPSALLVLLLAVAVYGTGRSWLGRDGALGAALVGLTASAMIDKGRLAEIDATYTALTGMACAVWLAGWARQRLAAGLWAVVGMLLGLGLLTKGLPHLAFFLALMLLCLGPAATVREAARGRFWLGAACAVLPLVLWLWLVRHTLAEAPATWFEQMTGRFSQEFSWRTVGRSLRASLSSLLNFMPWLPLALALARRAPGEGLTDEQCRFLKAAGWLGLGAVVLLPLVPGYRPRYSMPAYPPVLMALALAGQTLRPDQTGWKLWRALIALAAVAAGACGLASWALAPRASVWLCLLGTAAGAGTLVWWWRGRVAPDLWRLSAAAAVALALAALPLVMPRLARNERERPAAARVLAALAPGQRVFALRPGHVPFLFYLQGRYRVVLRPEELPRHDLVLLTTPAQAGQLAEATRRSVQLLTELDGSGTRLHLLRLGPAPAP